MWVDKSQYPKGWSELGFLLEVTEDGSPTLRLQVNAESGESMHHMGGAYGETVFIYGALIEEALKKIPQSRVLSLGLGLGYNEFLTAAWATRLQSELTDNFAFELFSFEVVEGLKSNLLRYCYDEELSPEVRGTYDQILQFIETDLKVSPNSVRQTLKLAHQQGRWVLAGDFADPQVVRPCHVLLYDAFSKNTNEKLWTDEFLVTSIGRWADLDCLFGTYACRSALKKALIANRFLVEVRPGYKGKRNSTRARRGRFTDHLT